MAELVVGLGKAAVDGTVMKVKSALEEEEKLKKSVQRDLILISDEFQMMNSFLSMAKDHVTDDVMRTLVRQIRSTALDVEDSIEIVVHLDNKKRWFLRILPSCCIWGLAVALDDAVAGIELLKARVEAMGQRNMRYSQIISASASSNKPAKQMHQQQQAGSNTASNAHVGLWGALEAERNRSLREFITNRRDGETQLRVLSVYGKVGMMSIIKKAYDDPSIRKNFKCRAWVKVIHPFNHHEFTRSLMAQFSDPCPPQQESDTVEWDLKKVMAFMEEVNNNYIVVLEDVSNMADWEAVRVYLPDTNNRSCIVVNTQLFEVASLCVGNQHRAVELEKFSDDQCVYVFSKQQNEAANVEARRDAARAWQNNHQLVGREMDQLNILLHAIRRDDVPVVSVWGMSGVGKSSLVKDAYFTEMINPRCNNDDDKFIRFAWMDVVSHPINSVDLSWSLLLELRSESHQHSRMQTLKDPIQECHEILRKHKSLVVFDGIQSTEQWDFIKAAVLEFGSSSYGQSRIVVITNEESVAKYCTIPSACVNVKGLQVDKALELFKNKVPDTIWGPALSTEVVKKAIMYILHRCGGIPKVIVAIADYLSNSKDASPGGILKRLEWLSPRFMYSLENDTEFRSLQDLFAWLHSYFRSCPDFLKPCIFYLSIFAGDDRIRRRCLLRRWIAEGYSMDSKKCTAEVNAEKYFSMLEEFAVILRPDSTAISGFTTTRKMPLCQMSGLYREYIISRSMEENLVFVLKGHCSMNSQRTGRHLVIEESWDRNRDVYESIDFSRLRSLTVFGEWKSFFISDKMRVLRVVDLEGVSFGLTNADLVQMVKLLPGIKFLSLRGCKEITRLPDSLGGLKQLQTLDVRHTSVATLPRSIVKLKKLQYIRAGTRPAPDEEAVLAQPSSIPSGSAGSWLSKLRGRGGGVAAIATNGVIGVEVPKHIGNLTAMNTLGVVDVSVAEGKAILKELKKLTQLHKLGVSGISPENCLGFFSAIWGHAHLQSLSVGLKENSGDNCLNAISNDPVNPSTLKFLRNLRTLKMYGLARKLPEWTKELVNLSKLSLQMIKLPEAGLDLLLCLPKLANLRLFLSEFDDDGLHFGRQDNRLYLDFLEISCNSSLQAITFPEHVFLPFDVVVEVLRIRCCGVSSLQISGIPSLSDLKEIWLRGTYDGTFKQHLESELLNYPEENGKPVLRLEENSPIPYLMTST